MSEWMNSLFHYPRILGLKLVCSGNAFAIVPHQRLVCVQVLHASVNCIAHICAQMQESKNELGE